MVIGLTDLAFFGSMKESILSISETLPGCWERLQNPLIKKQQSLISAEKPSFSISSTSPKEIGTFRDGLGKMIKGALGSFTAFAFNGAQILVVLITVFLGVVFTLMNPRPIFGALLTLFAMRHHDKTVIILRRIGNFI